MLQFLTVQLVGWLPGYSGCHRVAGVCACLRVCVRVYGVCVCMLGMRVCVCASFRVWVYVHVRACVMQCVSVHYL